MLGVERRLVGLRAGSTPDLEKWRLVPMDGYGVKFLTQVDE
jgi:hypothetical protein